MNYYDIDDSIPLPKRKGNSAGRPPKYPFAKMDVGQSVFFDGESYSSKVCIAAHAYGRRHGKRFSTRSVDGGLRVWRVE